MAQIKETVKKTNEVKEKRAKAIQEAREKAQERREEAELQLLNNESYIETLRVKEDKNAEFNTLKSIKDQLETIAPFQAKDNRKFSINVFPVSQFGVGLGQIVGIIKAAPFIDDQLLQYAAILGVNQVDLLNAQSAFGRTAYFKDGIYVPAEEGCFETFKALASELAKDMNIHEFSPSTMTKSQWDLYYAKAELRAREDEKAFNLDQQLDTDAESFIMED